MADYVVSAELELFISDFKKNISAAQNSLQNFEKQVKSASESTKNVFDGKSLSSFSSKLGEAQKSAKTLSEELGSTLKYTESAINSLRPYSEFEKKLLDQKIESVQKSNELNLQNLENSKASINEIYEAEKEGILKLTNLKLEQLEAEHANAVEKAKINHESEAEINRIHEYYNNERVKIANEANRQIEESTNKSSNKIKDGLKNWGVNLDQFYSQGSSIFNKFGINVDKFASHFGMSGKLMSAIVACVTALVKLGQEMDEMTKQIALGTGAMGDALDDLNYTAQKALVDGVGLSVEQTGKVVADLNTRFDMVGDTLEKTTVDFGKFAKVAGVDVNNAVNNVADVMARWNISTDRMKDLMSQLTKASQISGASVSELMSAVNTGQEYFRQFGMNLTQSTALLASFRKNGIQTETVLTGMRTALSKFSSEGRNAKEAWEEVSSTIKNAGSDTEALQIAVSTFGTRAGPEMVKAIREGDKSLADFTEQLRSAGKTLDETYDTVRTSKDAMADFKNALKGTFGGLGQAFSALWKGILDGITEFVRFIEPIVHPIAEAFRFVFTKIGELISWFVRELRRFVQQHSNTWQTVISVLNTVKDAFKKIFSGIVGIVKDAFGLIFSILGGRWEEAWIHAQLIVLRIGKAIQDAMSGIANVFQKLFEKISGWYTGLIGDMLKNALNSPLKGVVMNFFHLTDEMIEKAGGIEEFVQLGVKGATFVAKEVDLAKEAMTKDGQSMEDLIAGLEKRLEDMKGDYDDLSDLGDIGNYAGWGGTLPGTVADDGGDEASKRSTAWQQKRLQQQLDAIEKEKNEKLNALAEEGMAQADLDKVNEVFAKRQIEVFKQLQELKKDADLKSVESYSNAEEEKLKLNEYYADEEQKYILEVSTNTVKEKIKIEEKSTQWREKVLQQEIDSIEEKRKLEVQSMKDSGKRTKEIRDMQKQSIDEQIAKYRELMEIKKQNDLETAKGAEEKADVEKYYASESADYIKKLWETMLEETSGQTEKWYKTVGNVFMKVGNAIKTALTKTVNVVKNIFSNFMKIVKINPDDVLNMFLEGADAILTFFTDVLPQLPEMMEGVLNIITVLIDTLTQPEMLDKITKGVEDLIVKTVDYLVKNINKILTGLGKLIGALIKGIGKAISEIDWIELFGEILKGVWNAITEILNGVWEAVKNIGKAISDWWTDGKDFTAGQGYGKHSTGSSAGDLAIDLLVPFGFLRHFFAAGTNNAPSGLALVGEEGPELIDFRGGERVYNANATRDIMSSNGGASVNNWNVTFNNLNDTSAYTMMRQMKNWQKEMAISGVF